MTARLHNLNKRNLIKTEETSEGKFYKMIWEGYQELQKSLKMQSRSEVTGFGLRLELGSLPEELEERLKEWRKTSKSEV